MAATDAQHVEAIKCAVDILNAAMKAAAEDGLDVSVSDDSTDEQPVVAVFVSRHLLGNHG